MASANTNQEHGGQCVIGDRHVVSVFMYIGRGARSVGHVVRVFKNVGRWELRLGCAGCLYFRIALGV